MKIDRHLGAERVPILLPSRTQRAGYEASSSSTDRSRSVLPSD